MDTPKLYPVVLRCPPRDRTRRRLLSSLLSRPGRPGRTIWTYYLSASLTSIATYYRDHTCSFSPLWPLALVSFLQNPEKSYDHYTHSLRHDHHRKTHNRKQGISTAITAIPWNQKEGLDYPGCVASTESAFPGFGEKRVGMGVDQSSHPLAFTGTSTTPLPSTLTHNHGLSTTPHVQL